MIFGKTTFLLVCVMAIGCSSKTPEERLQEQVQADMERLGVEGNPEIFKTVQKVRYGMSVDEVNRIIGSEGELEDMSDDPKMKAYKKLTWQSIENEEGPIVLSVTIKDGKVNSVMYFDGPNNYGDNQSKRVINMKTVEQKTPNA